MPDPLSSMPDSVRLGDTLDVLFSLDEFSAADGWVATVFWIGATTDFSKLTTADGVNHLLEVTATETDTNLKVEQMNWIIQVVKGADKFTADSGTQEGLVNFTTASAQDLRSHNQTVLDNICAVIEQRSTIDQDEYTIKDRQLKRTSTEDLLKLKAEYKALVASDKRKEKGQGVQLSKVRFTRP